MERKEIETMIEAALGRYHKEVVALVSPMQSRLNGIYGNGSGQVGELERMREDFKDGRAATNKAISETNAAVARNSHDLKNLRQDVFSLTAKLDEFMRGSRMWSKKSVWSVVKWGLGGVGALVLMLASHWIDRRFGV